MFRTLAVLCLVAASAFGSWEGGLNVRFDMTVLGIGTTAFIELPQSETVAIEKGWVQKTRPDGPAGLASLVLWCPKDDYTVCVLLDDTKYIGGLQISLNVDQFSDDIFDWPVQGFTSWTTEDKDGTTQKYWTTQQYYITPETLATDPAIRIAARNPDLMLQDHSILVPGFNGELYAISTNVSEITGPNSDFTKQSCMPRMGDHYYFKMTEQLECKAETLFPFFPLVYSDQLIGLGTVAFGKHTEKEGNTNWFERPPRIAVKAIVPRGPECLYDLGESPGMVTLHTYFIKRPYAITCVF